MKELYEKLRQLISDKYSISITDLDRYQNIANVSISSRTDSYCWTHFRGETIEDALKQAIEKFEHPDQDYKDETGHIWKVSEESCFSENHIRSFLRTKPEEKV